MKLLSKIARWLTQRGVTDTRHTPPEGWLKKMRARRQARAGSQETDPDRVTRFLQALKGESETD